MMRVSRGQSRGHRAEVRCDGEQWSDVMVSSGQRAEVRCDGEQWSDESEQWSDGQSRGQM